MAIDRIREALDPERMVAGRQGRGGPQPAETRRMLGDGRQRLDAGRRWLDGAWAALRDAEAGLEAAFDALAAGAAK